MAKSKPTSGVSVTRGLYKAITGRLESGLPSLGGRGLASRHEPRTEAIPE
jgi:hypothetical protein